MGKPIIVDANILFSALLNDKSSFGKTLLNLEYQFFACESMHMELSSHKEKLIKSSKLKEEQIIELFRLFLKKINHFKEDNIAEEHWLTAHKLCEFVDEKDTSYVALTLELDGLLWTGDKKLIKGLKERGFDRFFQLD